MCVARGHGTSSVVPEGVGAGSPTLLWYEGKTPRLNSPLYDLRTVSGLWVFTGFPLEGLESGERVDRLRRLRCTVSE